MSKKSTRIKNVLILCFWIIFFVAFLFFLRSCYRIVLTNDIPSGYMHLIKHEGKTYVGSESLMTHYLDFENKTYTTIGNEAENIKINGDETLKSILEQKDKNIFYCTVFAAEQVYQIPEGYEKIASHIEGCLSKKSPYVEAMGFISDGKMSGFVQFYKDLHGRGRTSVEEIEKSILFSYNAENDEFTILHTIDDVVIIAFHEDTVIYWKDKAFEKKAFYKYNVKSGEETYLIEHESYDAATPQWSRTNVCFNNDFCIIRQHARNLEEDREYMHIYNWSDETLIKFEKNNPSQQS